MRLISSTLEKRKPTDRVPSDETAPRGEKRILQSLALDKPVVKTLEALARQVEQWYRGLMCSIWIVDAERRRFGCVIAPSIDREALKAAQQISCPEDLLEPKAGNLVADFLSRELATDLAWVDFRQFASHHGLAPQYAKVIRSGAGGMLGIIALHSRFGEAIQLSNLSQCDKACHIAAIAIERSRLYQELSRLSEAVIHAQETERRRIARELHDGVNQMLSSAAFRIQMIDAEMLAKSPEAKTELEQVRLLLGKGIDEIQRVLNNLRPGELDAFGLVPAVRSLCEEFRRRTNLGLKFDCDLACHRLPKSAELALYRILQEAFNNIEKHSGGTQASLQILWEGTFVRMVIRDNGKGWEPETATFKPSRQMAMGLLNMRERATHFGGTFSIQSTRSKGTEIEVRIPITTNE